MISIVVPIYNTPEVLLRECLNSLESDYPINYEVRLIDDGSVDYIKKVCQEFTKNNKNFYYHRQKNGGVSSARNVGIQKSEGEWIAFVDPDDIFFIDKLVNRLEELDSNSDIIFLGYGTIIDKNTIVDNFAVSDVVNISKYESLKKINRGSYLIDGLLRVSEDFVDRQGFFLGTPWGKLFRRQFLIDNNLNFDLFLKKRQDALFCASCYALNPHLSFDRTREISYLYRIDNHDSITKKYNSEIKSIYLYLFKKMEEIMCRLKPEENVSLSFYAYDLTKELINLDFCNVNNKKKYKLRKNDFVEFVSNSVIERYFIKLDTRRIKLWKRLLYKSVLDKNFFLLNLIFITRKIRYMIKT